MTIKHFGKLVEALEDNSDVLSNYAFGKNYSAGVYQVVLTQGGNKEVIKVIKK